MASSDLRLEEMASPKLTAEQAVEIGERYFVGNLLERNETSAKWFFRFAADQNHPVGQLGFGFMLKHGRGGARNEKGARALFAKAAAQGHPAAQNNLADMLEHGRGGPRDEGGMRALFPRPPRRGIPLRNTIWRI